MKIPSVLGLILALVFTASVRAAAPIQPTPPQPGHLAIVVVDSLQSYSLFNRMAAQFERVFKERKWPITVEVEQFAANSGPHDLELRIFTQRIRNDFGELRFRAWMILYDHGVKHDFGIVEYSFYPRPFQMADDTVDQLYAGAANKAVALVAPYLAPNKTARR